MGRMEEKEGREGSEAGFTDYRMGKNRTTGMESVI